MYITMTRVKYPRCNRPRCTCSVVLVLIIIVLKNPAEFADSDQAAQTARCVCDCVVVVVALLFYVHGKHLRSCRDGQLT